MSSVPTLKTVAEAVAENVYEKKFGKLEKDIKNLNIFLIGIVIAFFVGFITLFIGGLQLIVDGNRFREQMYNDLKVTLSTQDNIIQGYQIGSESKTTELDVLKNKINQQQGTIDCLKSKKYFAQECFK